MERNYVTVTLCIGIYLNRTSWPHKKSCTAYVANRDLATETVALLFVSFSRNEAIILSRLNEPKNIRTQFLFSSMHSDSRVGLCVYW